MEVKKYKLRILPIFEDDLNAIVDYIVYHLNNHFAAYNLVNSIEEAIMKRLNFPESFEAYLSLKERKYPYYRIYVNNYIIYYVVIEDVMEIRRIIYNKRNIKIEI